MPEVVWDALAVALPQVTDRATFYEQLRRVEWSLPMTGVSWGLGMTAAVEGSAHQSSILRLWAKEEVHWSLADHHRKTTSFETLVSGIARFLECDRPPMPRRDRDEVRWWNGVMWAYEPPRDPPGWQPDPLGRHQLRYWDGGHWTSDVADGSGTGIDPL